MVARAVARVPRMVAKGCYVVARVLGVVARAVARVPRLVARVLGWLLGRLLGYPGWLLRCCYAVARVLGVVARVLLCGC